MQPQSPNKDGFDLDLSSEFVEPMLRDFGQIRVISYSS